MTGSEVPVFLSIKGFRRHLALIAQTGSGKTYLAGILADELLAKGGTVVMLDPHADYVFLGRDAAGKRHELSDRITVFQNPSSTGRYSASEDRNVDPKTISGAKDARKYIKSVVNMAVFTAASTNISAMLRPRHLSVVDLSGLSDEVADYIAFSIFSDF